MTPADIAALRAGHCLAVIPETFIACGEGGSYCSETCRLRTLLAEALELAEEGWEYAGDYFADKWDAKGRHDRIKREGGVE